MNFLDLCKKVARKSGITASGPTAVVDQTGILAQVVDWTAQAVLDIQNENTNWKFLWRTADANLVTDRNSYLAEDLGIQGLGLLKLVFVNGKTCEIKDWEWWVMNIRRIEQPAQGLPTQVTIAPDGSVHFYPAPDNTYQVTIDYYHTPIAVENSTDVPVIPVQYHNVIVDRALVYFAEYEDDNFRYQQSVVNYERGLDILSRDQLPQIQMGIIRAQVTP